MANNINPTHYKECSFECIEMMEAVLGIDTVNYFCMGNAFKYLWRFKNKNGEEDLNKAEWYLNKLNGNFALGDKVEILRSMFKIAKRKFEKEKNND